MSERLAAGIEAAAFLRRAEAAGGFGTVLRKGDAQRGTMLLLIAERGISVALLERMLLPGFIYGWNESRPDSPGSADFAEQVERRRRNDPDCWILELDIPDSQRFIAGILGEA